MVVEGYKQTEIGVIPEDWDLKTIESLTPKNKKFGIVDGPFGSNLKTIHYRTKGVPIVTSGYVTSGKFSANEYIYVDREKFIQEKRSAVSPGDIVMAKIGANCGASAILPSNHEISILSGNALKISIDEDKYNSYYVWQILWELYSNDKIEGIKSVGAQPAISMSSLKKYLIPTPPKEEQQAIATALSDTDALIDTLEKLIAKKEAIKTGTMQELLTGKKRLDGDYIVSEKYKQTEIGLIPEDWEIKTFQKIFSFLTTATYSRAELSNNGVIQYLHYGDIHTKYNFTLNFLDAVLPTISADKLKKYPLLKDGDIVMADASEDYQGICKSIEIKNLNKKKVIAGLHTFLLRDKHNIFINGFRGYLMASSLLKNQFDRLATGMKVYGVSKGNLLKIQIPIPPKLEQQLITTTLLDMDKEIEALKSKLSKVKVIKEGMMQELLTGKTRLLEEVS